MKFQEQISNVTIFLLALGVFFTSCGSDDNGPTLEEASIVGTWTVISAEASNCDDEGENGSLEILEASWTFNDDGTFAITNGAFVQDGTYVVTDTSLELIGSLIDNIPRTFVLDNDALTVVEDTQEEGCIVTSMFTRQV